MRTKCSSAHSQSDPDLIMRGNLMHSRAPMFAPTPDHLILMDFFYIGHILAAFQQTNWGKFK